jgi:5'-nucleotidase (lipoprotein e(P4) family)
MKNVLKVIIVLSVLISCKGKSGNEISPKENQDPLLLPVLWYQKSGEMQALYYQGYNIAKYSLLEKLGKADNKKPKAVIMDIDETILDNSPVEAFQAINNVPFSTEVWNRWVETASAEPLPGALDFIKLAESKGVEVFYVTNRKSPGEFTPTILNLRNKGFPFADSTHLILKTNESSKKNRRDAIAGRYDILLFIGDNLADFDDVFDDRGTDQGFNAVIEKKNEFGSRFIILPNPMYGPWINAATNSQKEETKREKIMKTIKSF